LKTLPAEISKLHQSNLSQIQLDLPVGDNESVRIRLSLRGGEIHSTFITESAELRDALQKAWPDFTATHRTQGMRFADSQFQDGLRQQNDAASDQGRQRNQEQDSSSQSSDYRQPIVKKNIPLPPTQTNRQGKLNLWA
jgi:flagellar hook-length control protein FliK